MRPKLKYFIERKFGFLAPYAPQLSIEVIDLTYKVSKSFLNLLAYALINEDYWRAILNILEKNWDENCDSGALKKIYCVCKKLVAAMGYTISSCFSRAFNENGMILNQEEKDKLDKTLKPENIPESIEATD